MPASTLTDRIVAAMAGLKVDLDAQTTDAFFAPCAAACDLPADLPALAAHPQGLPLVNAFYERCFGALAAALHRLLPMAVARDDPVVADLVGALVRLVLLSVADAHRYPCCLDAQRHASLVLQGNWAKIGPVLAARAEKDPLVAPALKVMLRSMYARQDPSGAMLLRTLAAAPEFADLLGLSDGSGFLDWLASPRTQYSASELSALATAGPAAEDSGEAGGFAAERARAHEAADTLMAEVEGDAATMIHAAAMSGSLDALRGVLDKFGPENVVNLPNESGWTPLKVAVRIAWEAGTRLLLRCGANPNLADKDGFRPIDNALSNFGDDEGGPTYRERAHRVVLALLEAGASANTCPGGMPSLFVLFSVCKDEEIIDNLLPHLLEAGADPRLCFEDMTLLHAAASRPSLVGLTALTGFCDVNKEDKDGDTALHVLFMARDDPSESMLLRMVAALLEAGANPNAVNHRNQTPTLMAAARGYLDICSLLVNSGGDPNIADKDGHSAMDLLKLRMATEQAERFAQDAEGEGEDDGDDEDEDEDEDDEEGQGESGDGDDDYEIIDPSALAGLGIPAELAGDPAQLLQLVRGLISGLEAGQTPEEMATRATAAAAVEQEAQQQFAREGDTDLHRAVRSRNSEALSGALQAAGESVFDLLTERNADDHTALMEAIWFEWEVGVRLLLQHGADPNDQDQHGIRPIDVAMHRISTAANNAAGADAAAEVLTRNARLINMLLDKGASAEPRRSGQNFIFSLVRDCSEPAITELLLPKLLKAGADVQEQTRGMTALHIAAGLQNVAAARLLCKALDVNHQDDDKDAPLHLALQGAREALKLELLQELLEAGADPNIRNSRGQTPLFIAAARGFMDAVEALIAKGGDVNIGDQDGHSAADVLALHAADAMKMVQEAEREMAEATQGDGGEEEGGEEGEEEDEEEEEEEEEEPVAQSPARSPAARSPAARSPAARSPAARSPAAQSPKKGSAPASPAAK